jgi:hypothetical protein
MKPAAEIGDTGAPPENVDALARTAEATPDELTIPITCPTASVAPAVTTIEGQTNDGVAVEPDTSIRFVVVSKINDFCAI